MTLGLVTFVAINTLVFLGLAVAKVVPWPEPIPPRLLRAAAAPSTDGGGGQHIPLSRSTTIPQRGLLALVALLARVREAIMSTHMR